MKQFQNVLTVIQGHQIPEDVFRQLNSVIGQTQADFSFMVLHPEMPESLGSIQDAYEDNIQKEIRQKLADHGLDENAEITFETTTPHFVAVIQGVLKHEHDLVIKTAEPLDGKQDKGFRSLDMSLLRKCPCPVWLIRDVSDHTSPRILTAVDPSDEASENHDLNIKLLEIGETLSNSLNGSHTVISCWEFEHENTLRKSPFIKVEDTQLDSLITDADKEHKQALETLLAEAKISDPHVARLRGETHEIIPSYVTREGIDIVVMGTVARTGISGFIIGNTAENILQNLSCGMFAVKPNGFVSPIKAY